MIKAELAKINKNKLIKIAMVIIMLIPAIYSVTFLRSMWDPHGNLD